MRKIVNNFTRLLFPKETLELEAEIDAMITRACELARRSGGPLATGRPRRESPVVRWAKVIGYLVAVGAIIAYRWEVMLAILSEPGAGIEALVVIAVVVFGAPLLAYRVISELLSFARRRLRRSKP